MDLLEAESIWFGCDTPLLPFPPRSTVTMTTSSTEMSQTTHSGRHWLHVTVFPTSYSHRHITVVSHNSTVMWNFSARPPQPHFFSSTTLPTHTSYSHHHITVVSHNSTSMWNFSARPPHPHFLSTTTMSKMVLQSWQAETGISFILEEELEQS